MSGLLRACAKILVLLSRSALRGTKPSGARQRLWDGGTTLPSSPLSPR